MGRTWWLFVGLVLLALSPAKVAKAASPPGQDKTEQDILKLLKKTTAPQTYTMQCGETPEPHEVKIDGFRVVDLKGLTAGLRNVSKDLGEFSLTLNSKIGNVNVVLVIGGAGANGQIASKNSRFKGEPGQNASFAGGDDVRAIVLGGDGGNGLAGHFVEVRGNENNLNGGDGGDGGRAIATWGERGVVLAISGNGGDGGSRDKKGAVHMPGGAGRAGGGGDAGSVFMTWDRCSVVGARGGIGGYPNNSGQVGHAGPPQNWDADPGSTVSSLFLGGGNGGSVILTSPRTPNLGLPDLAPAAAAGDGQKGAAAHVKKPLEFLGGFGGNVIRNGPGAKQISAQAGRGGAGNPPGMNGTIQDN